MTEAAEYVICIECGGRNRRGEDFCGDCGAYLNFEASSGETAESTAGEPTGSATGEPAGSAGEDHPVPAAEPAESPRAESVVSRGDGRAPAPSTPDREVSRDHTTEEAKADAVDSGIASSAGRRPVSAEDAPEAAPMRKPTAPATPRARPTPAPAPVEPPTAPDDIICPACGAGNRPERRFCRRCATQLKSSAPAGSSAQPAAGSRPKGWSTRFPFTAVFVLLVLIGIIVVAWLNRGVVIGFIESIVGFIFSSQSP